MEILIRKNPNILFKLLKRKVMEWKEGFELNYILQEGLCHQYSFYQVKLWSYFSFSMGKKKRFMFLIMWSMVCKEGWSSNEMCSLCSIPLPYCLFIPNPPFPFSQIFLFQFFLPKPFQTFNFISWPCGLFERNVVLISN